MDAKTRYLESETRTKKRSPEPQTSKKKPLLHPPHEQSMTAILVGIMSSLPTHRHELELKYKLRRAKPPAGRKGECQIHLPGFKRLRNKKALFIPSFIQQPFIERSSLNRFTTPVK